MKSPSNGPEAGQGEQRASLTLAEVHRVLQVAFGWEDAHLHRFTDSDPFAPLRPIDGEIPDTVQWMPQDCCEEPTDLPEEGCSLDQLLVSGSGAAFYEYDFGDSWLHRMELVTRRPVSEATVPARLTGGARRGLWKTPEASQGTKAFWTPSLIRPVLTTLNARSGSRR